MYHVVDCQGLGITVPRQQKQTIAIHCLQRSIEAEPKSGQSLYLLGRCLAASGKIHDAFIAYRYRNSLLQVDFTQTTPYLLATYLKNSWYFVECLFIFIFIFIRFYL